MGIHGLIERRFVRFCMVGGIGFVVNFILLTILYKLLGTPLFIAQLLAGEIALFGNFLLHTDWTYKGRNVGKSKRRTLAEFHATSWAAIVGTAIVVSACVQALHMHYAVALAIGGVTGLVWNFLWAEYVVWKKRDNRAAEDQFATD